MRHGNRPQDQLNFVITFLQAEEMAQTFRQRIAQAEAMARADMLRFQPEVIALSVKFPFHGMLQSFGK